TAPAQKAAEVAFWNRVRDCATPSSRPSLKLTQWRFSRRGPGRLEQRAPISLAPQVPSAPPPALSEATRAPRGAGAALQFQLRDWCAQRADDRGNAQRHLGMAKVRQARADGRARR